MSEGKKLRIAIQKVDSELAEDYYIIKVVMQTHRASNFGKSGSDSFLAKNDWLLVSQDASRPKVNVLSKVLYVIDGKESNGVPTLVPKSAIDGIAEAVREYNVVNNQIELSFGENVQILE